MVEKKAEVRPYDKDVFHALVRVPHFLTLLEILY